jgi:uncharacterized protein (TIGR03083 family)
VANWMEMATDERRDLAELLAYLTPEQWRHESLCEGWTVRDVVAHVVSFEELSWLGVVAAFARNGIGGGRVNQARLDVYRDHQPQQLVDLLRAHLTPRGLTAAFGGRIGLTDCLIHHQDIRRPLGIPRAIPQQRLVTALNFSLRSPVLPSKRNGVGLRLRATDFDWQHGDGDELSGPAESILLALAGRIDALSELEGPGLTRLQGRVAVA